MGVVGGKMAPGNTQGHLTALDWQIGDLDHSSRPPLSLLKKKKRLRLRQKRFRRML
jgi:hypothetical protein